MTEEEKRELRDLLAKGIDERGQTPDDILRDSDIPLDEDSGQFYVTHHERIVFQLEPELLPALLYAYSAYEDLIDLTSPPQMSGRCLELIQKARDICPDFKSHRPELKSFSWFAKEFFDIGNRQAFAYFQKRDINLLGICQFADEPAQPDDEMPF